MPGLTGMRGLAAMYVLLLHFAYTPNIPYWLRWFPGLGWSGVDFFFVLSGYLLATLYNRPSRRYFIRRIFRTFPLYYLSLPLYVITGLLVFSPLDLIYAQNYFAQTFSGGPLWTLTLEELFYFVALPVIMLLNVRPRWLIATGLASSLAWAFLPRTDMFYLQMPEYFICYATGIFFAKNSAKLANVVRAVRFKTPLLTGGFVAAELLMWFGLGGAQLSPVQPILYSFIYGLIIVFMQDSVLFTNRISHFLGKISYGMYVLQLPLLYLFAYPENVKLLGPWIASWHLATLASVSLAAMATIGLATVSYYIYESPLVSLGRKLS